MIFGFELLIRRNASFSLKNVQSIRFADMSCCLRCETIYPRPNGGNLKIELSFLGRKYGYISITVAICFLALLNFNVIIKVSLFWANFII